MNFEEQYRSMLQQCLEGESVPNPRTGVNCLTSLNHTLTLKASEFPILTSRRVPWKIAIKEMIAYIRGATSLREFHDLGVKTWDANCQAWKPLDHNIKTHSEDCGLIYGASAAATGVNFSDIVQGLCNHETRHDRGIIWNFWNPAYFHLGCLRPCMMMHHFNVLGKTLHLTSYQRSQDVALGGAFNIIQAWFLLRLAAELTGLKMGDATLHVTNAHVYENQVPMARELLDREPYEPKAKLTFKKPLTMNDILRNINNENFDDFFELEGYESHDVLKFPFTV